jgi:hypothetical protein
MASQRGSYIFQFEQYLRESSFQQGRSSEVTQDRHGPRIAEHPQGRLHADGGPGSTARRHSPVVLETQHPEDPVGVPGLGIGGKSERSPFISSSGFSPRNTLTRSMITIRWHRRRQPSPHPLRNARGLCMSEIPLGSRGNSWKRMCTRRCGNTGTDMPAYCIHCTDIYPLDTVGTKPSRRPIPWFNRRTFRRSC